MKTFLGEVAQQLYEQYGKGVSDLTIVFPSRRATRFFAQELAMVVNEPIWQPHFASIDDLVRQRSGLEVAHELVLIAELYRQYNCCFAQNQEDFDSFYNWGRMLLSDFDTIDKYMIDPRVLYSNMSDLRELEELLGDQYQEKELILNFWRTIKRNQQNKSGHFATFDNIWSGLSDLYFAFQQGLIARGIGYSGMIYRQAAELFAQQEIESNGRYIFVGFNALNRCEQIILETLADSDMADFFWDGDDYFIRDKSQEAGLFLRRNVARFPTGYVAPSNFEQQKEISVIKSPNDIMQCKALQNCLSEIIERQGGIGQETAVVLTDESLLPVLLHSLPEQIKDINVTMGASLSQSAPYVFFERLVSLQRNHTASGYYCEDLLSLLQHPYIQRRDQRESLALISAIMEDKLLYYSSEKLRESSAQSLAILFSEDEPSPLNLIKYYSDVLKYYAHNTSDDDSWSVDNNEFTLALIENLRQIGEIVQKSNIQISISLFHSLLGKVNANTRIPYDGDPLRGLQVMGILESRTLDFENVIVLSMSDENFPGNRAVNSFIPVTLRRGFGLPTIIEAGAMWSYYFYRLISRAQNVTLIYSTSQQDNATGEQSRFISQLEYESPHTLCKIGIDLSIRSHEQVSAIEIEKSEQMVAQLERMRYSPSSIKDYINCPMQFYFQRVARISNEQSFDLEIKASENGTILHNTIESLYGDFVGRPLDREKLASLREQSETINDVLEDTISKVLTQRASSPDMQVSLNHMRELLLKQIDAIILFDMEDPELQMIESLEKELSFTMSVAGKNIRLYGKADRIDRLKDGTIRIIDYKSGKADPKFKGIDSLFDNTHAEKQTYQAPNQAALQGLIYTLARDGAKMGVYSLQRFSKGCKDIYLFDSLDEIEIGNHDAEYQQRFTDRLKSLLAEIIDPYVPFRQSPHIESCTYCSYATICQRQVVKKW